MLKRLDQEMPRPAARIAIRDLRRSGRPARKRPRRRPPWPLSVVITDETQKLPRHARDCARLAQRGLVGRVARKTRIARQHLSGPPRAKRVVQQEFHHVGLGEELRHRRQFGGADLATCGVHRVLFRRPPELVGPAKAIVGGEHFLRQPAQQPRAGAWKIPARSARPAPGRPA